MASTGPIWEYFSKTNDIDKATCKICNKSLSLGSTLPKKQTTTNIKNHLAKIHENEWAAYCKINEDYQSVMKKKSESYDSPLNEKKRRKQTQTTLPEIIEKKVAPPWPDNHPISLRIDKSIMDLIIVDMLPYNLVEGKAFQRLHLNDPDTPSRYRKKSEKYFRTTLMPLTYEKVKGKVVLLLQKAEWVSFTTDIWSNPTKTCSLLSCTAHFIDGPKREKVILAASVLEEDHTGQHISAKLYEIIAEFNLTKKVHMVIRDNAYNMQAAMRCGSFLSIGCVAHTLQLVIHDVIFKDPASMNMIKKCRKIVGHFKRSEQASRYLEGFQKTCGLPRHVLIQDIETRWNSTYLMLERLLEQKTAINLYMAERGGIEVPTAEEWEQISYYIALLRCFYQATLDISSDSSSISLIIPLIVMLNSKMTTKDEDPDKVTLLKIQLRDSINRRFSYVKDSPHLMIATLIDPRFKSKYLTNDETENTKTEILSFLRQTGPQSRSAATMDVDVDEPRPSCSNSEPATEGMFSKKKMMTCGIRMIILQHLSQLQVKMSWV